MFLNPNKVIAEIDLRDGLIVADFGAGSGHHALLAAKAVAPNGKLFAVDIQTELLSRLKNEAHSKHIRNIEIITADLERVGGSRLKDASCDVVIASNILFMIGDKKAFISEAKRVLKPGGRLLLVDWSGSFSGTGPHAAHVLYKDDCMKLVTEVGFTFDHEIDAGSYHYGIIFRKS